MQFWKPAWQTIWFHGLRTILRDSRRCPLGSHLCLLSSQFCPLTPSYFLVKDGTCLQLSSLLSLCLACRILGSNNLLLLQPSTFPCRTSQEHLCCGDILKSPMGVPYLLWRCTPFHKRLLHRFSWINPSLLLVSAKMFEGIWVTCLVSTKNPYVAEHSGLTCEATPLAFSPKQAFLTVNLLTSASFAIWISWEFLRYQVLIPFCLMILSWNSFHSGFAISSKKNPACTFKTLHINHPS